MGRVVVKGDIGWKGGNTPSLWTRIMYRIDAKVMEVSSIHKTAKKEEIFYFVDDTSRVKNIVHEKILQINIRLISFVLKRGFKKILQILRINLLILKNFSERMENWFAKLYILDLNQFLIFFFFWTLSKSIRISSQLYNFLKIFFLLNSVYFSILYSPIFKFLMSL